MDTAPVRYRTTIGAASLIVGPLLMSVGDLFHPQESYQSTRHAKIFLAQPRGMSWELLNAQLRQAAQAVRDYDEAALQQVLASLLPEFAQRDEGVAEIVPITRNQA